ncbi:MAG: hypothetical protein KJ621_02715 [Proteobacteria bacterium]|nr:hypothetical protein [Pseudomonadota bacterium]MBU1741746.1 hypothetical protein [Pseudomonadota bacterium]
MDERERLKREGLARAARYPTDFRDEILACRDELEEIRERFGNEYFFQH